MGQLSKKIKDEALEAIRNDDYETINFEAMINGDIPVDDNIVNCRQELERRLKGISSEYRVAYKDYKATSSSERFTDYIVGRSRFMREVFHFETFTLNFFKDMEDQVKMLVGFGCFCPEAVDEVNNNTGLKNQMVMNFFNKVGYDYNEDFMKNSDLKYESYFGDTYDLSKVKLKPIVYDGSFIKGRSPDSKSFSEASRHMFDVYDTASYIDTMSYLEELQQRYVFEDFDDYGDSQKENDFDR